MTPYELSLGIGNRNRGRRTIVLLLLLFFGVSLVLVLFGLALTEGSRPAPKVHCDVFCKELQMNKEQEKLRINQELKAWEAFKRERGIK